MESFEQAIDWSEVPQTISEYKKFTGTAVNPVLPKDHPSRPIYHGKGFGFPKSLPTASRRERRIMRHVSPKASEKNRHWIANSIIHEHGEQIIDEIMAATYDGKMTPMSVFACILPEVWTKDGPGTTLVKHDIRTQIPELVEEESNLAWWRSKRFLAAASAAAAMGLMGVMMIPMVPGNQPPAEQTPQDPTGPDH
jgi:hypothetical protein